MSTTTVTPITKQNPFEAARLKLIAALLAMKAPSAYPAFPYPSDHESVAEHIREAASIFDEWLAAVGAQVRDNASEHISSDLFSGSFTAAIDGNETYACEMAGVSVREERRSSMRRAS